MSDMTELLTMVVPGKPEPQGSVKAFVPTYKSGAPVRRPDGGIVVNLTSDNPALKAWRERVAETAAATGCVPVEGAVELEATFYVRRPQGHYGTGRNEGVVRDAAPAYPITRGGGGPADVDKYLRALLDALSEVVYVDDCQVVDVVARKRFAALGEERTEVVVRAAEARTARETSPQMALA